MASGGEFTNKVAVITGASSGLGQTAAILLAKKGASVVLCGRDEARLQSSLDQCVDASGGHADRFTYVVGDVTKSEVRKAIVDKAIDTFQRMDILVANAGILMPPPTDGIFTEEMYDELFDVNVKSQFFLIQSAIPHLEKSGGNIVNVSSLAGTIALPNNPLYPMTKATVDHMTRCLALDLAPKGIRVNAVNPSFVPTRIVRNLGPNAATILEKKMQGENSAQHLHGECVTSEAIADTIAFLASDAAKFVTGQCHVVDGGRIFAGSSRLLRNKLQ